MKEDKKMKKFIICLISLMLAACAVAAPVGAAVIDEPGIEPLWENTDTLDVTLDFENNVGTAYSSVIAEFDATYIITDIYVYRVSGDKLTYVAQNHETVYDYVSCTTCDFAAVRGATYRIDYIFTVRRNGVSEVINRTIYGTYTSQHN